MPQLSIVNPLEVPDWDAQVLEFPEATVFHSAAWARVLIESYGFKPQYCVKYEGGKLSAALPLMEVRNLVGSKRGVSLPFSDFCEPLFPDNESFHGMLDTLKETATRRHWDSFEIRGGQRFLSQEPFLEEIVTHDIDLAVDEKKLLGSFRDSTKRNIRSAERNGVEVTHSTSIDALRSFYRLNCLTRREHGLPPQPWRFFQGLWDAILKVNRGFITIATHEGKDVASDVFFLHGKKAIYKYGASDSAFQHLRASNLVMWEGIRKCRELGCSSLNLGRTETHHEGLLQFKRGFGCAESKIRYYRYDTRRKSFLKGIAGNAHAVRTRLLSSTPIPVLRIIGKFLYRYVG